MLQAASSLYDSTTGAPSINLMPPPDDLPLLMSGRAPQLLPGGCAIQLLPAFVTNFGLFSNGAFTSLFEAGWGSGTGVFAGVIVAGGAVCTCLTTTVAPLRWRTAPNADVDVFLVCETEAAARDKIRAICELPSIKRGATFVRTPHSVTICSSNRRNVQIILRIFPSVSAILSEFDVDACAVCYDGRGVFGLERAARALATRVNIAVRRAAARSQLASTFSSCPD